MNNDYQRPDGWGEQPQGDPWNTQTQPFSQEPAAPSGNNPAQVGNQNERNDGLLRTSDILVLVMIILIIILIAVGIILAVVLQKKPAGNLQNTAINTIKPTQQIIEVIPATEAPRQTELPMTDNHVVDPVTIQTSPSSVVQTNQPTAAKPRISAEIRVSAIAGGDGYSFTLYVSGNYAYYDYDLYEYIDYNDDGMEYLGKFRSDQPETYLTAGSSLTYVMVVVTPFNADGISGEPFTCLEYMPQSSPAPQGVTVQQCWQQGEIITYGKKVAGFTTAYVVNHAQAEHVRDSLGNGWHIVAVNYCYSYGIHWYELYDADDGDYYGWVDLAYIDFW